MLTAEQAYAKYLKKHFKRYPDDICGSADDYGEFYVFAPIRGCGPMCNAQYKVDKQTGAVEPFSNSQWLDTLDKLFAGKSDEEIDEYYAAHRIDLTQYNEALFKDKAS